MKTSFDRQIIALFWEIRVAESNGYVIILIGSRKIAVCAHAQYEQNDWRDVGCLQVAMHSQLPHFLVNIIIIVVIETVIRFLRKDDGMYFMIDSLWGGAKSTAWELGTYVNCRRRVAPVEYYISVLLCALTTCAVRC